MKKICILAFLLNASIMNLYAQDKTTVTAQNSEISDNLDLRAIATIFGESSDLEDFEKRINDPKAQISNLDLNNDNYVDYLRVIESIEGNDHIIVIQSVIDKDLYQDIATIEVQRDKNKKIQVQVVGDVFMYGSNYIYEPVYVHTPIIYSTFWVNNYRPYYSNWYWGYYPPYYSYWRPFPVFRYRNHINVFIGGYGHVYKYVHHRNCKISYNAYYGRRANAYERKYPNRSFSHRNALVTNRYELDKTRNIRTANTRESVNRQAQIQMPRNSSSTRSKNETREQYTRENGVTIKSTRNKNIVKNESPRKSSSLPRVNSTTRNQNTRVTTTPSRNKNSIRENSPSRSNSARSSRITSSTRGKTSNESSSRGGRG